MKLTVFRKESMSLAQSKQIRYTTNAHRKIDPKAGTYSG